MLIRFPPCAKTGPLALLRPHLQVAMTWSQRGCFWGHHIRSVPKQHHGLCLRPVDYWLLVSKPELTPFSISIQHCFHLRDALQKAPFSSSRQCPRAMWDALGCCRRAQVSYHSCSRHVAISSSSKCPRLCLGWKELNIHLHSSMRALPSLED